MNMVQKNKNILIHIDDSLERKRILGLLKHAGYPFIVSKRAQLQDKSVRLLIMSDLSICEPDSKRHTLVLIDRFEEIRSDYSEDLSVNWIKRPFNDEEFLAQVQRSLLRQRDQSGYIRRKKRLERITRRLEELADTDPLTGLFNMRYFTPQLQKEVLRAKRYGTPVSLMMIDLDHFKAVNDQHGHPAGDEVLRKIGEVFKNHLRTLDIAVRYGGDEFAIILPNTPRKSALVVVEKLRQHVSDAEKKWAFKTSIQLSIGIAEAPKDAEDASELVHLADQALYQNKKQLQN
ncbi:GGDEF domain-containing protein [candidate division KSB1 bacterium]|nr:GGDEF domain-containing protein [candidate division KSB1 bacterium]